MIFRIICILLLIKYVNFTISSSTIFGENTSTIQLDDRDIGVILFSNDSEIFKIDVDENIQNVVIDILVSNSLAVLPVFKIDYLNQTISKYENFEYHWEKNGKPFTNTVKIAKIYKVNFAAHYFKTCTPFESGNYSIILKGSKNYLKIIHIKIGVKSIPLIKFTNYKPVNFKLNDFNTNWTATTEMYLYPEGNIIWKFIPCNYLIIAKSPICFHNFSYEIDYLIKHNSSDYFINSTVNFQPKDSGILSCTGVNQLGNITKSINILLDDNINVYKKFDIRTMPIGNITNVNNTIILKCSCLSFYNDLDWYSVAQKSIIKSNKDHDIVKIKNELENSINLKINNAKLLDQGTYECRCYKDFNNIIYDKDIIYLNVNANNKSFWLTDFIYIVIAVFILITLIGSYIFYYKKIKEKPWTLLYDEKFEFPVERIKIESELGSGAFGVVFEAIAEGILPHEKETTVAIKTIKKSAANESTLRALESELEILLKIGKHLNIINLLGCVTKTDHKYKLMVIVEFCNLGNLKSFVFDNKIIFNNQINQYTGIIDISYNENVFSTNTLIFWAYQIAKGMEYVSLINILHGDLAARNILLCNHNIVKICDFGLAKSLNYQYNYQAKGNTPLPVRWLAIETLECGILSTFSDIWSFGVFVWELFSLCNDPYRQFPLDRFIIFEKLANGYRLEKPKFSNNEIYHIMMECWKENPKERISFTCLVKKFQNILVSDALEVYNNITKTFEEQLQMDKRWNIV